MNIIPKTKIHLLQVAFRLIIGSILFVTQLLSLSAQTCCPDGITFNNQAQINEFPINHPNCTHIFGDVLILGGNDLIPFNKINTIDGDLLIEDIFGLSTLEGLDSLSYVGGELAILNSINLQHVENLSALKYVGGLHLKSNKVKTLSPLENLTTIQGDIILSNCELNDLSGFNWPDTIKGDLTLANLDSIIDLDALHSVNVILGDLTIMSNTALTNIDALQNTHTIGGNLDLYYNSTLQNIEGLSSLEKLKNLYVRFNYQLQNLNGLRNLHTINNDFILEGNWGLLNLEGLGALDFIGKSFNILKNKNLRTFKGIGSGGFTNLDNLSITENRFLFDLEGLEELDLKHLTELKIIKNINLNNCDVKSICEYVLNSGNVEVSGTPAPCDTISNLEKICRENLLEDFKLKYPVRVFPNPASDLLSIKMGGYLHILKSYTIFDVSSREIQSGLLHKESIDISTLVAGVYYIQIILPDERKVVRFVKM